jgi:hypothetical protein
VVKCKKGYKPADQRIRWLFVFMATNTPLDITTHPIRDNNGRFLTVPPNAAPRFTTDTAKSAVQKRVEKYRQATVKRIVLEAKSIDPTVETPSDAFGILAAKQYTAIMDSERPAMQDVERLHKLMTGASVESQRENVPTSGIIAASAETMMQLLNMIEARQSAAVDKARAIDANAE